MAKVWFLSADIVLRAQSTARGVLRKGSRIPLLWRGAVCRANFSKEQLKRDAIKVY